MKSIESIVVLQVLLGILTIGQQMEKGDGKKIIIIMTGGRVEEPKPPPPRQVEKRVSSVRHRKHKKDRWLQQWVKRMMLSKKLRNNLSIILAVYGKPCRIHYFFFVLLVRRWKHSKEQILNEDLSAGH